MTATAHRATAFELHRGHGRLIPQAAAQHVTLRATGDGWSLLNANGEAIFRGLGRAFRRECLERARDLGVLAVISG
ncbi:MAG: hypothetical protein ABI323_12380 [Solirubrobacteraceae bacterium]